MDNSEVIQMLREELARTREEGAKKDLLIESLVEEVRSLRHELSEFTRKLEIYVNKGESSDEGSTMEEEEIPSPTTSNTIATKEKPSDSSREEEGTTPVEMEDDKSSVTSTESLISPDDDEAAFETVKSRKARRAERFSSDEESSARKSATPTGSPVRSPLKIQEKTKEATPPKKAKKARKQTGKSDFTSTTNDFPPLPSPTPAAGNSAAPPASAAPQTTQTKVTPPASTPTPQITKRPPRPKGIPPIVISNAGNFVSISSLFRTNNIQYTSAVVVRNGIKIFPASEPDFRKATELLEKNKEPYFTFRFPEEKPNHVVLRGAPIHLTNEKIAEDLTLQGFSPKKIIRWSYSDGNPMPMVLVLLPKAETNIYKVRSVCTFNVRVEAQKPRPRSTQCYNCQDHGHAAPCCHIPAKCVKCGESHHTSQCQKSNEAPPKCANCAGEHPASFSGCPKHPSQQRPKKSNFKGWGSQDNSALAPQKTQTQPPPKTPALASNEALLPQALLAQLTQLITATIRDQLQTLMTPLTN